MSVDRALAAARRVTVTQADPLRRADPLAATFQLAESLLVLVAFVLLAGAYVWIGATDGADDDLSGNATQQAVWILLYGTAGGLLLRYWKRAARAAWANRVVIALVLLAVASTGWSETPSVTGRRAIGLAGSTVLALWLGIRFGLDELRDFTVVALGGCCAASIALAVGAPSIGVMGGENAGAWSGVFGQKNVLGIACGLALVSAVVRLRSEHPHRAVTWGVLGAAAIALVGSRAMTSIVATAATLCLIPLARVLWRPARQAAPVLVFAVGALLGGAALVLTNWLALLSFMGKDPTLTGRTEIWAPLWAYAQHRPWLGYGFGGFFIGETGLGATVRLGNWIPPHAHNGLLGMMLDLGLVGVAGLVASLWLAIRRAVAWTSAERTPQSLWPLLMVTFMLIAAGTELVLLKAKSLPWVLFVAMLVSISARLRPNASAR